MIKKQKLKKIILFFVGMLFVTVPWFFVNNFLYFLVCLIYGYLFAHIFVHGNSTLKQFIQIEKNR